MGTESLLIEIGTEELPPTALKSIGLAFRDNIEHSDVDGLVVKARSSEDAKEGIRARLEKREPVFNGT